MSTISLPIRNIASCYTHEVELTFQCPDCLAIETLYMESGTLTETRHWRLFEGKVYHRNSRIPARLINASRRRVFIPSSTTVFLLNILEKRKETISQFAGNIGVSRITVKRWLLGKCHPNCTSRRRIAKYTNTPVKVLSPKRKWSNDGFE